MSKFGDTSMIRFDENTPALELTIAEGLSLIKQELKKKGIKYQQVAELMGTSEVTVKRMLNGTSISLSRIMHLAEILELELDQLFGGQSKYKAKHSFFTKEQDSAFFQNPKLWSYFVELFFNRKSPEDIEKQHGLTPLSTYQYLKHLEAIQLIELEPNNNFKVLVSAPIGFSKDSMVIRRHMKHMMEVTFNAVMCQPQQNDDYFLRVKPMRLSKPIYGKMIEDLKKVLDKYSQVSEVAFTHSDDARDFQIVCTGHPLVVEDYESINLTP